MSALTHLSRWNQALNEVTSIVVSEESQTPFLLEKILRVKEESLLFRREHSSDSQLEVSHETFHALEQRINQIFKHVISSSPFGFTQRIHDLWSPSEKLFFGQSFCTASAQNCPHLLKYFLDQAERINISEINIGLAIVLAAKYKYHSCLKILMDSGRPFSEGLFGLAVASACRNDDLNSIQMLLRSEKLLRQNHFNFSVYDAVLKDKPHVLGLLLAHQPIHPQLKAFCLSLPLSETTSQVLRLARVDDETVFYSPPAPIRFVFEHQISLSSPVHISSYRLSIELNFSHSHSLAAPRNLRLPSISDAELNPEFYLSDLAEKGLPAKIILEDSPGVDVGGLLKDFISALFLGLKTQKKLSLSTETSIFPCIKEEDEKAIRIYKQLAVLYSALNDKNKNKSEKVVTGMVFQKEFFELLKILCEHIKTESLEELLNEKTPPFLLAEFLAQRDPGLKELALVLNPNATKETIRSFALEILMLDHENDEKLVQLALENAKKELKSYLIAPFNLYKNLSKELQNKIKDLSFNDFCETLQGKEVSKEALISSLVLPYHKTPELMKKCTWIKQKIQNSDLPWRKKFVKLITAQNTLTQGTQIHLKIGNPFQVHTCFNTLELPSKGMSQQNFLCSLEAIMDQKTYNMR